MNELTPASHEQWETFLRDWNNEFLLAIQAIPQAKRDELLETYPEFAEPFRRRWLGREPATLEHIRQAERRLGVKLPSDYIAFLQVSDGWLGPGFESHELMISPIEEVDFYSARDPEKLQIFRDQSALYFTDGERGRNISSAFLDTTIALCRQSQSVVLLFDPASGQPGFWHADFHDAARVFATFGDLILFEKQGCDEGFSEVVDMFR